jgi:hypothetical protein
MTRREAEDLMKKHGCIDLTKPLELHITYCRWINIHGNGTANWEPLGEAYRILRQVEPPASKQAALFDTHKTG